MLKTNVFRKFLRKPERENFTTNAPFQLQIVSFHASRWSGNPGAGCERKK